MLGIQKSLETFDDLKSLALNGIQLAKDAKRGALGWGAVFAGVVRIAGDVKELVADAPAALPELKDLDQAESGQLASAAYGTIVAIVEALKAA